MRVEERTLPEGRYGPPPARRAPWTRAALVAAGLLVGVVVAFLAYRNLGSAPISTERIGFADLPDNRMRFTFEVSRDTPDSPAVCVVRVRGLDGAETGRREVHIPPGPATMRVETTITGADEPVTADVYGCSYQVPPYLSTA